MRNLLFGHASTRLVGAMLVLFIPAYAFAQPKAPPAVVELIEDDVEGIIKQLNNDGGQDATQVSRELRDVYSGVASIRVTPFQRFSSRLQGWQYPIVEKPQPGQYRFLRFAWKRIEGDGIMIQLHSNGRWDHRYYAGTRSNQTATWGAMMQVDAKAPREWTVVTRDLFKDWGTMTLQGFALTTMENGVAGLFDHVYLGRSIEDLDRVSAQVLGKTPLKDALTEQQLGALWDDLAKPEVKASGAAFRKLVAGRKESVAYLAKATRVKSLEPEAKKIARWIQELDDEDFAVRESAYRAIDKLGDVAVKHLQKARVNAGSQELRNRIDALLKNRGVVEGQLTGEQFRLIRVARILEASATPEALQALDALVKEPPDGAVAADIKAARDRLAKASK